ncbi:hypothetical protein DPMN_024609 [Dreissena polymorpha]|uniref:Uncharacterized protein n=1 Tax=Dreissena polymorpha TaxID=45954 RepID=A0A9D4RCU7_DREPO|nr:hypothetical protein DPMN_024609 [Dreissena polymorpha]
MLKKLSWKSNPGAHAHNARTITYAEKVTRRGRDRGPNNLARGSLWAAQFGICSFCSIAPMQRKSFHELSLLRVSTIKMVLGRKMGNAMRADDPSVTTREWQLAIGH